MNLFSLEQMLLIDFFFFLPICGSLKDLECSAKLIGLVNGSYALELTSVTSDPSIPLQDATDLSLLSHFTFFLKFLVLEILPCFVESLLFLENDPYLFSCSETQMMVELKVCLF